MKTTLRTIVILLILSANIGCDQVTKTLVRNNVGYHEQITLITDYMTLTRVENTGAFLSAGHALPQPVKLIVLLIIPSLVLGILVVYVLRKSNLSGIFTTGICFIAGGGIGNMYDRFLYGSVTDFLHMDLILFKTGIFNMADVSIMLGTALVLFQSFVRKERIHADLFPDRN